MSRFSPLEESGAQTHDPKTAAPVPPFPEQEQISPGLEASMVPAPDYGESSYRGFGRLQGRVALITGGDSGIGRAVALAFAREGAHIAFTYLPEEQTDADVAARHVLEAGVQCLPLAVDLFDIDGATSVIARVVERFGSIDILVNNAAYQGKAGDLEDFDTDRVERTLRVNILAPFILVREVAKHMPKGGCILNVSSIQAYDPSPSILDYATTKGALVTFTKGLAQSFIDKGIRVNSVAPGPVWTPLIVQSFDAKKNARFGEGSPMGRPAQPAELAPTFVFLASDEARYINGEVLGVTGGRLLA